MNFFKKILSYPLTVLHYLFFGFFLLFFHPIQWIAFNLIGYSAHKKVVDYMNLCLVLTLYFLGSRVQFINNQKIPENVPLIMVTNHQSTYDIPPVFWFLRKYHPKFVSKIELGKGIPSVSYNLRHGGSVLIDRKDARQSLTALNKFGNYIETNKRSAVIFPEGTRSRNGKPKKFSENGIKMLVKKSPSSYILPITINNSWKLVKNGAFPLGIGIKVIFEVHKPIKSDSLPFKELIEKIEKVVKDAVLV
jgi:1-acyl-sn-glycerol-3-phosphate acyltransferase